MKRLLILGAGTGGSLLANLFSKKLDPRQWEITVIDKSADHVYQPGLLFLPLKLYGYETKDDVARPVREPIPPSVNFHTADVKLIDHKNKKVETDAGVFSYDWLVIGMGCGPDADEVEGLSEALEKDAGQFYTLDGALKLQNQMGKIKEGRVVVHVADMPVKCPVAPIEFIFLADYYFQMKGLRDRIDLTYVTPLSGAFTKPNAAKVLANIMREKNVKIVPNFNVESVDSSSKTISSFGGEKVEYDFLVSIPPNVGPETVEASGLGDGLGYAITDPNTLKSKKAESVYIIGDNSNVPTSKAGSVAHFEAEIIVENILREMDGKEPHPSFDGHTNCFIEAGFHKAFLLDFNYDIEPVHGTYPVPGLGPFHLLENSILNHWGKMAFKWIYWNLLLTGKLPGDPLLPSQMSHKGKKLSEAAHIRHH